MPKKKMRVVYAASRNLYPYLLPTITSLLDHNNVGKIYLMIEDDELPYAIPKCCEIVNVSGQKYFPKDGPNMRSQFTYLAMLRVCYASLFANEDRLIQLDVDTIVNDDLSILWNMDLTDKWFAAVPEHKGTFKPYGDTYYNMGVAVFNLAQIRQDNIEKTLVEFLNTEAVPYIDQDAWNKYGTEKSVDLPVFYNECIPTGFTNNPIVVHFAGYNAWWLPMVMPGSEYKEPYKDLYGVGKESQA